MIIGTTFSYRHLNYLKLNMDESLNDLLRMRFDLVRIGVHWDDIEHEHGIFDFSHIRKILDFCERNGQDVVLAIGMKAPRWPEFYLPRFLKNKNPNEIESDVLKYIEKTIKELSGYNCIKYFQVENESMDPSGPDKLTIPFNILKKEAELISSLDSRPIIVNLWGNDLTKRNLLLKTTEIADVIGIDLYYKTPSIIGYHGPKDSDTQIKEILKSLNKPFWFTELQAEPWEKNEDIAFSDNPPSINSSLLRQNFDRAKSMHPAAILLWGFEYWLYKKKKGDLRLWNTVQEIVKK